MSNIVRDVRKAFNFRITVVSPAGKVLSNILVQDVEPPEDKTDVITYGAGGVKVGVAGMTEYGKIKIKRLMPLNAPDNFFKEWRALMRLGGGITAYGRTVTIEALSDDNITPLSVTDYLQCFPISVKSSGYKKSGSEAEYEEIELQVNGMRTRL